jgi:hypothetical protein
VNEDKSYALVDLPNLGRKIRASFPSHRYFSHNLSPFRLLRKTPAYAAGLGITFGDEECNKDYESGSDRQGAGIPGHF